MTALRLENISHRASTICGSNCLQIIVTNHTLGTSFLQIPTTENLSLRRLLPLLASTVLGFRVLLSAILPFTVLYRAVSASASFILWLFIPWKFHVTDGQNRSLIFRVKRMPTSFLIFLLLPHPTSTYPISAHPTQHRYRTALSVLLNVCDATSDPSTFICLPKSQPNQISHLTVSERIGRATFDRTGEFLLWSGKDTSDQRVL